LKLAELIEGILTLKPRLNRFNKRLEYRPYEYDRGVYVIDVSSVEGYVNGRKNMLLSNFWALLLGLLRNVSVGDVLDTGGSSYSLRTSGDVNRDSAIIAYGFGTTPEAFTQYNLASPAATIAPRHNS